MGWGERKARVVNLAPAGGVCASQGTFSSFYYFKHQDQYLFLSVQT